MKMIEPTMKARLELINKQFGIANTSATRKAKDMSLL